MIRQIITGSVEPSASSRYSTQYSTLVRAAAQYQVFSQRTDCLQAHHRVKDLKFGVAGQSCAPDEHPGDPTQPPRLVSPPIEKGKHKDEGKNLLKVGPVLHQPERPSQSKGLEKGGYLHSFSISAF